MKKKVTKSAYENLIKSVVFVAVGCFILMLLNMYDVIDVQPTTWYLLLALTVIDAIQWAILAAVFQKNCDEAATKPRLSAGKWIVSLLPAATLLALVIVIYAVCSSAGMFAVDAIGCLIAVGIVLAGVVLCYLLDFAFVVSMKKYQTMRSNAPTVQVVKIKKVREKKEKPEKKEEAPAPLPEKKKEETPADPNATIFPDLVAIDREFANKPYVPTPSANVTLKQLCDGFNAYLESNEMYYLPETIRAFVSGLACSHFMILEGLSGTGKTSLPKFFAEYTGANICFTSVQASWRDRSDVLGYYNDFAGKFKETPFLRALYRANYEKGEVSLVVLDEMNLSRVEYYFADFLSVLELDEDQWTIELMPASTSGNLPAKLEECAIKIPQNVWFIGTANKDDSTFTVTDKVYDRAVIIDFAQRNESHAHRTNVPAIHLGVKALNRLYDEAMSNPSYVLTRADYDRFSVLTKFVLETFDLNFGNRILNQIVRFVPVYVACGGNSAKALDLMFSRKVMRKLDGRFDDGIKANLVKLERLILQQYNKTDFSATLDVIAKLKRKLF